MEFVEIAGGPTYSQDEVAGIQRLMLSRPECAESGNATCRHRGERAQWAGLQPDARQRTYVEKKELPLTQGLDTTPGCTANAAMAPVVGSGGPTATHATSARRQTLMVDAWPGSAEFVQAANGVPTESVPTHVRDTKMLVSGEPSGSQLCVQGRDDLLGGKLAAPAAAAGGGAV